MLVYAVKDDLQHFVRYVIYCWSCGIIISQPYQLHWQITLIFMWWNVYASTLASHIWLWIYLTGLVELHVLGYFRKMNPLFSKLPWCCGPHICFLYLITILSLMESQERWQGKGWGWDDMLLANIKWDTLLNWDNLHWWCIYVNWIGTG